MRLTHESSDSLHSRLRLPGAPERITLRQRLMRLLLRFRRLGTWIKALVVFMPTILAATYYFAIATDQYESEARFVVRSAARPELTGGLAFLVQLGLAKSQDDAYIVKEFMVSRDALGQLQARLDLKGFYGDKGADFLARYPSFLYGPEEEEFHKYYQRVVSVIQSDKSGIGVLRVRAFRAEDARLVASTLLLLSEELVNRINQRIQSDAIGNSHAELALAQRRLIEAQALLTEFRNRELIVNPEKNAVALAELIARLSAELGVVQAQITEPRSATALSPQLAGLLRRAAAIEEQIVQERARISGDQGLATRIASFQKLSLEREFADRMLLAAEAELARSRAEAARQLLYLERVVQPNLADYSTYPRRVSSVLTVFGFNFLAMLVLWLIASGVKEHGSTAA